MASPKGKLLTPLMIASFYGKGKVVKVLLKHGAQVNRMNSIHTNALIMATMENRKKVVQLLLKAGADASVEDEVGSGGKYCASAQLLVPFQAGMTPLDWADDQANEAIMKMLKKALPGASAASTSEL